MPRETFDECYEEGRFVPKGPDLRMVFRTHTRHPETMRWVCLETWYEGGAKMGRWYHDDPPPVAFRSSIRLSDLIEPRVAITFEDCTFETGPALKVDGKLTVTGDGIILGADPPKPPQRAQGMARGCWRGSVAPWPGYHGEG